MVWFKFEFIDDVNSYLRTVISRRVYLRPGWCKTWTLDSGLDHGLDSGLHFGLDFGLDIGPEGMSEVAISVSVDAYGNLSGDDVE